MFSALFSGLFEKLFVGLLALLFGLFGFGCSSAGAPKNFEQFQQAIILAKEIASATGTAVQVTGAWDGNLGVFANTNWGISSGFQLSMSAQANGACARPVP